MQINAATATARREAKKPRVGVGSIAIVCCEFAGANGVRDVTPSHPGLSDARP